MPGKSSPSSSSSSSSSSSPGSNDQNADSSIPRWRQMNREIAHASSGSNLSSDSRYSSASGGNSAPTGHRTWRAVQRGAANTNDPHGLNTPGLLMTVDPGPRPPHEDPHSGAYEYGPTRLPPVPYKGDSPFTTTHPSGRRPGIPLSAVEFLPQLEQRVASVERAVDGYMEVRAHEALERASIESLHKQQYRNRNPTGSGSGSNTHPYPHGSGPPPPPSGQYPPNQPGQHYQYQYQYR